MNITNEIRNYIYTSKLRLFLRKLGIIRLLKSILNIKFILRSIEYKLRNVKIKEVNIDGIKCRFYTSDINEFRRIMSYKDDKHLLKSIVLRLKPGDTFWDVGANLGLYSIIASIVVGDKGKVYSFEPEERVFKRFNQNISLNKINNITISPYALGNKDEKLKMLVSNHFSSGEHRLTKSSVSQNGNRVQEVEVLQGDTVNQLNRSVPTFIKIDVEGFELEVIEGLKNTLSDKKCKFVLCEVHFSLLNFLGKDDAPLMIVKILKDNGFQSQKWLDHSHLLAEKSY